MNEEIDPKKLEAWMWLVKRPRKKQFQLLNPEKCDRCDKKLDDCTHEDPDKAGLFFWNDHWYCDACLLQFGKEEVERAGE